MSDICRTQTEPESQFLAKTLAVGLSTVIAVASASGFLIAWKVFDVSIPMEARMGGVLLAFFGFLSQFIVVNYTVKAREALKNGYRRTFWFTLSVTGVFALISMWGLENFWAVTQAARGAGALRWYEPASLLMSVLFAALAFAEPALFWALQALKHGDAVLIPPRRIDKEPAGARKAHPEGNDSGQTARTQPEPPPARASLHVVPLPERIAPPPPREEWIETVNPDAMTQDQREALAKNLLRQHLSPAEVIRRTKLPKSTVYDWAQRMRAEIDGDFRPMAARL